MVWREIKWTETEREQRKAKSISSSSRNMRVMNTVFPNNGIKKIKKHPLKMPNSIQFNSITHWTTHFIHNLSNCEFLVPFFICVSRSFSFTARDAGTQNRTYISTHNIKCISLTLSSIFFFVCCFVWFALLSNAKSLAVDVFGLFYIFYFSHYTLFVIIGLVFYANNNRVRHKIFYEIYIIIDQRLECQIWKSFEFFVFPVCRHELDNTFFNKFACNSYNLHGWT